MAAADGASGEQQPSAAATSSLPVMPFRQKLLAALGSTDSDKPPPLDATDDCGGLSPISMSENDKKPDDGLHPAATSTTDSSVESKPACQQRL